MFAKFFPWRLFNSLFWTLLILFNGLFALSLAIGSYVVDFDFFSVHVLTMFLIYFLLSLLAAFGFAYRFSSPLRHVILKTLRMVDKRQVQGLSHESEILDEQLGEYADLERALDRIGKKLKRRKAQYMQEREEIEALMSSMDDAVVSLDLDGKVKYFNSRFAALFMVSGSEGSFSKYFREPEVLDAFREVTEKGEVIHRRMQLLVPLDQKRHYFSLTVSPLRNERSKIVYGAIGLFHDISEMKRAELMRAEFVANASHELRTPLTSIKGYVNMLQDDVRAGRHEQAESFLGIIAKGVDRLNDLVADMLTLTSLDSGMSVSRELVDPKVITQEVVEQIRSLADSKKVSLEMKVNAGGFHADPAQVRQVMMNLLANAVKYVPTQSAVMVEWLETPDQTELHIIDNGPGIAAEHLPRLFERFYRVDKGRTREAGGTGLGLAIVKHIMQSHGGQVSVRSEPGRGSEFICRFPR